MYLQRDFNLDLATTSPAKVKRILDLSLFAEETKNRETARNAKHMREKLKLKQARAKR